MTEKDLNEAKRLFSNLKRARQNKYNFEKNQGGITVELDNVGFYAPGEYQFALEDKELAEITALIIARLEKDIQNLVNQLESMGFEVDEPSLTGDPDEDEHTKNMRKSMLEGIDE